MSCPDCTRGYILPGEPAGRISDINGAYFTAGPDGSSNKRAVIFLTDVFGLPLKNSKIMADNFAKRLQCDVWVPDLFNGHPPLAVGQLDSMPDQAGVKMSIFGYVKIILFKLIPAVPALIRSRPSVAEARVVEFVGKVQAEKKYEKLGAVGYCFGGTIAASLGSKDIFNSVVICHPGGLTAEQIRAVKVPASWVCAEEDMSFKRPIRLQAEEIFEERKGKENFVEYEFKDYKGTVHGFAARPNLGIPEIKAAFEAAFEQTVEWFNKTLPI